jgi:hypothetical protein
VRVHKAKLEVQEPREAHCKWRKTTKACLLSSCTNGELDDRLDIIRNVMLQSFLRRMRRIVVWIKD